MRLISFRHCLWLLVLSSAVPGCAGPGQPPSTGQSPASNTSPSASVQAPRVDPNTILTGEAALDDWTKDEPGVRRMITLADLPAPFATTSSDNGPNLVPRPAGALPKVPAGFAVEAWQTGLSAPRAMATAPNGDIFVAESMAGRIKVLRPGPNGGAPSQSIFAQGLNKPFGIAFYPNDADPQYVYIGDTDAVVRFPYQNGDLVARAPYEKVADLPGGGLLRGGGHWTRDVAFSKDGKRMFVSVGSHSNDGDDAMEDHRADILSFRPDGADEKIYASGIRNAVGITINPTTGDLWASVNERDDLGDNLIPDYITHVIPNGFYGWPWWYMGGNQDPRHKGEHPELKQKVITPDVLLQSHSASLQMAFYEAHQFPKEYVGDAFAAEHGSWNRARRTGYKVIRVRMKYGRATGEYDDFMTGFVTTDANVWGRPVGVTVAKDGSLLISDDGSGTIWRVTYVAK